MFIICFVLVLKTRTPYLGIRNRQSPLKTSHVYRKVQYQVCVISVSFVFVFFFLLFLYFLYETNIYTNKKYIYSAIRSGLASPLSWCVRDNWDMRRRPFIPFLDPPLFLNRYTKYTGPTIFLSFFKVFAAVTCISSPPPASLFFFCIYPRNKILISKENASTTCAESLYCIPPDADKTNNYLPRPTCTGV